MTKWAYLENIAIYLLAGFLCWLFKNGWGRLVLLCVNNKVHRKNGDE